MSLFTFNSSDDGYGRLIGKLLILVIGFLFVYTAISYVYRKNLITPLDLFIKKIEPIKEEDASFKVVFLGDSHPGGGIKNRYLPDDFYNLGFPDHNLQDQYLLLKWAHSRHPELEYVVLQADFHIFSRKAFSRKSPRRSLYFSDLSSVRENYDLSYYELMKQVAYYYFPLLNPRRRFSLPKFFYYYARSSLKNGGRINEERYRLDEHNDLNYFREYRWDKASNQRKKFAVRQRIYRQFGDEGPYFYPDLIEAFEKIKHYTLENNLKIIFLRYPVTEMYLESVPLTSANRKRLQDLLETRNSVLNLNFSRAFRNRQQLFRNSDHLNYRGGKTLTRLFLRAFKERVKPVENEQ